MSNELTFEKLIEISTEIGVKTALETMERIKEENRKSRHDKRLRNTKLLLKNYRNFITHCSDAVYKQTKSVFEILDEFENGEGDDELYVEAIKASTERTAIILDHVKKMIDAFRYVAEKSPKVELLNAYKVIYNMYISDEEMTAQEIADLLCVEIRSIWRYRSSGIEHLSGLIFGIDSLKL